MEEDIVGKLNGLPDLLLVLPQLETLHSLIADPIFLRILVVQHSLLADVLARRWFVFLRVFLKLSFLKFNLFIEQLLQEVLLVVRDCPVHPPLG